MKHAFIFTHTHIIQSCILYTDMLPYIWFLSFIFFPETQAVWNKILTYSAYNTKSNTCFQINPHTYISFLLMHTSSNLKKIQNSQYSRTRECIPSSNPFSTLKNIARPRWLGLCLLLLPFFLHCMPLHPLNCPPLYVTYINLFPILLPFIYIWIYIFILIINFIMILCYMDTSGTQQGANMVMDNTLMHVRHGCKLADELRRCLPDMAREPHLLLQACEEIVSTFNKAIHGVISQPVFYFPVTGNTDKLHQDPYTSLGILWPSSGYPSTQILEADTMIGSSSGVNQRLGEKSSKRPKNKRYKTFFFPKILELWFIVVVLLWWPLVINGHLN